MKRTHSFGPPEPREVAGFALVLTITLLAFLVLLIVGLASITKIETRLAAGEQNLVSARQNAWLAVDSALALLQATGGSDQRVTSTADAIATSNRHYTGVWNGASAGTLPLAWLVSGNSPANPLAVTPATALEDPIELIGLNTSGVAHDVDVPRQTLHAANLPGRAGPVLVGHYAWWIGDQGVKASVAAPDPVALINYAPFEEVETRTRIYQQLGVGAGPTAFEPRAAVNLPVTSRILMLAQAAFCKDPGGSSLGLTSVQQNFHAWSSSNFAVLANSAEGGLRQDLSLQPSLLGAAFAAWADYASYMEDPASPLSPRPVPALAVDHPDAALRRRYRLGAGRTARGIVQRVAPVLSHFLVTFSLRADPSVTGSIRPLEARARWMASLWNPYTSAIVPEELQLEVSGLPTVQMINDSAAEAPVASISLDALYGSPLRIDLPWLPAGRPDQQSWLPGRVYAWTSSESLDKTSPIPAPGFSSNYYIKNFSAAGQGVQRAIPTATVSSSALCHLTTVAGGPLTLRLFHQVSGTGLRELLGTFVSPDFAPFSTTPEAVTAATYQFSYFFRLAESIDTVTTPEAWLTTPGQDPRETVLPSGSYVVGANGNRPELYRNFSSSSFPDRLLDRSFPATGTSFTGQSYNEDTPLFEFPRGPLLSLGSLQHLALQGQRPFTVGNSWGQAGRWNAWFDRYFFSGYSTGVALPELTPAMRLPNPGLQPIARKSDGGSVSRADLAAQSDGGFTSKFLLQSGAFNLNSTSREAWSSFLRSGRYVESGFSGLNASAITGTAADTDLTPAMAAPEAAFFRFAHSAQETVKADAGYAGSTTVPPTAPNVASVANTHLFRSGVRILGETEIAAFADATATLVAQRIQSAGPFRSLEEFLGVSPLFIGAKGEPVSLLEKAIELAGLNRAVEEFSSQWLTQADVMTTLAPALFARSDTFLIRAYGDSVNPITGELSARAWAEAVVQRMPAYVDPIDSDEAPATALSAVNTRLGRRFKIVSFRWLTAADI